MRADDPGPQSRSNAGTESQALARSTNGDLCFRSIAELARLIRSGQLSPVELVEAFLARIRMYDPVLTSYITVCEQSALRRARRSEAEVHAGHYRGPLHGIPYGVKDQFHTRGVRTTLGSRLLVDNVPSRDATVVRRMNRAGAIMLGKHNLREFGKGGNRAYAFGEPRNPWDPTRTAEGSSSGSGVAVAAGLCAGALGADTGGSIRYPAAVNGVVGLRPTFGRVSRAGGSMYAWTADTVGPMGRSVGDCALLLKAIAGHDREDPLTRSIPVPDYVMQFDSDLRGVRVGVVREFHDPTQLDPDVSQAMDRAHTVLLDLGADLHDISLPLTAYGPLVMMLTSDVDAAHVYLRRHLRDHWHDVDEGTRIRMAASCLVPGAVYGRAMRARTLVRREIRAALRHHDILISPTMPSPAESIAAGSRSESVHEALQSEFARRRAAYAFSVANVPAIAVPAGHSREGLPLSLQLAGAPFAEALVLRVAHAYEEALGWYPNHPSCVWSNDLQPHDNVTVTPAAAPPQDVPPSADDLTSHHVRSMARAIDLRLSADDADAVARRLTALLREMRKLERHLGHRIDDVDGVPFDSNPR